MYAVSSNFLQLLAEKNAKLERRFYIGSSDYSAHVLKFPSISKQWDELKAQTVTIDLSNEGRTFNFIMQDPTKMRSNCSLQLGLRWSNLLRYSDQLNNAAWVKGSGLTVTSTDISSTAWGNAERVQVDSGAQAHSLIQVTSNRSSELATVSGYFKAGLYADWVALHHFYGALNSRGAFFNVVSGTIGTVASGTVARISSEGDGWWRCSATRQVSIQSGWNCANIEPHTADNQSRAFTGTGSEWLLATGLMLNDGELRPYLPTTTSGGLIETMTIFAGTIDAARYSESTCSLTLIDKFKRLSDRKIGDTTSPVSYAGSSYLIHDLAWYACTSLGGLSAVASTSNPDIDYGSYSSWTAVFSADNVRASAHLTGQQPIEMLRQLSRLTQSAIYIENDKLKFSRFMLTDSAQNTLNDAGVLSSTATLDDRDLINKQFVSAAYNVSSRAFGITVFDTSTASVNSFGLRENLVAEQFVWLTDSVSALNLAQRVIVTSKDVISRYNIKAPMQCAMSTIGDAIIYQDSHLQVDAPFRIMAEKLNMDDGTKEYEVDLSQVFGAFVLDASELDGTDVLL